MRFSLFFLDRFLAMSRYLRGIKDRSLRGSSIFNPRISNPMSASQEPGGNGVSAAATPRMINTMPRIVLVTLRIFSKAVVGTDLAQFAYAGVIFLFKTSSNWQRRPESPAGGRFRYIQSCGPTRGPCPGSAGPEV